AQQTEAVTTTTTASSATTAAATTSAPITTAAESTTTTTAAPAPVTAPVTEPPADSGIDVFPYKYGVWLASDGNYEGEYYDEDYYCFNENGSGSVLSQASGTGVAFGYEQDGGDPMKWVFHMGAVEDNTHMEILEADNDTMKIKWENSDFPLTLTYMGTRDEFSFYDNYSLGRMAQFIYGMGQYNSGSTMFDASLENGRVSILIFDPAETGMQSILEWYYIDRFTGKGNDRSGNPIDLTVLEGNWAEMPYPNTFNLMPAIKELDTLRENGEMLGFWYIGYVEPDMDNFVNFHDLYLQIFERTGMDRKVRYLNSFPSDSFVTSGGGQELYLLLPSDIHGSVTISELVYDDTSGSMNESRELYRQEDNLRPILLKCNRSETMPDVIIRITDSKGEQLEWIPCISGENGKVITGNVTNKAIRDFTDYNSLMHPDNMPVAMG
ncbi:MAG: hypothetical protein J6X60_12730, partial [Ruminiclostridium sp.]|nr:hypothetical protein [Ruminiclostridium sp.]